jgi:hypothetical protein
MDYIGFKVDLEYIHIQELNNIFDQ